MAIGVKVGRTTAPKKEELSIYQIQKTAGVYRPIGMDSNTLIVNVLGTKSSCFYCSEDGEVDAVAWGSWVYTNFAKSDKTITLHHTS